MNDEEYRNSIVYWGTCGNCLTTITLSAHPEREEDIPDDDEWEGWWPDCPVCDNTMNWEGTDPHWAVFKR